MESDDAVLALHHLSSLQHAVWLADYEHAQNHYQKGVAATSKLGPLLQELLLQQFQAEMAIFHEDRHVGLRMELKGEEGAYFSYTLVPMGGNDLEFHGQLFSDETTWHRAAGHVIQLHESKVAADEATVQWVHLEPTFVMTALLQRHTGQVYAEVHVLSFDLPGGSELANAVATAILEDFGITVS